MPHLLDIGCWVEVVPSTNVQSSSLARSFPTVDFPDPDTPIMTRIMIAEPQRRTGMKPIIILLTGLLFGQMDTLRATSPVTKEEPTAAWRAFLVKGRTAFIIPAKADRSTNPEQWVWYAPTLPGLPGKEEQWMFEQFRDAGIAIAGIDVGESFGSPAGCSSSLTFIGR